MTMCKLRLSAVLLLAGGLTLLVSGCVGGGLPVINILTVPTTVIEGATATLTVRATSGGGGPIIYSWTSTCGGTFVPNPSDPIPSGQTHTVEWTAPAVTADTTCTITVTATSRGRSASASRSMTVLRIPFVVSTVPAHNATAVPVTVDIVVTFDGPMNPATLVLTCLDEEGPEDCNMTIAGPTMNPGNTVATWTVGDPDAPFSENLEFLETYSMRVMGSSSGGVPMAAPYEWSFTTATASPPVISAMTVPSPVTEDTTGHTVSVIASDSGPLSYSWSASGPGICSSIAFSPNHSPAASTSTMTVPAIPATPLPRSDLGCTIRVTVSGPGGETSDSRPSTVLRIPFVVSTVPADLATGVLVTTEVQVTFDGSMTPASLALLCTNEGPATFPVTGTPCNMTFGTPTWSAAYAGAPNSRVDVPVGDPDASPTSNLEYQKGYKLQVNANSVSGVPMASAYSWEFATEATPLGRIIIQKTAVGGDDTFNYTSTIPGNPTFQITTSGGSGSLTFDNIDPDIYTVTEEDPPTGWDFTDLVCVDPDNGTTVDLGTRTANIDLDTGEIITCTYTNTRRGTIVINKTAVGGDDTFAYTTSATGGLPATFQITTSGGSGSQTFTNIVPGAHTVTEDTPPANWSLTGLSCTDPDGGTTVDIPNRTANIDLDPGETVTCTYTNTYTPPILPQCPANITDESEPNDSNDTAQVLNLAPGQGTIIVRGGITPVGDLDYYQITVTEPSLVFANVRTNLAAASPDSTLFIGVNPVTTGFGCTGTGFIECDDDDGDQASTSSTIAGRSLDPGTYNILVKQYSRTGTPGSGTTMIPYRLYVAVVPTTAVITETEPNDTPSTGYTVMSCPFVVTGTGGGTGGSDYYRFLVPGGNSVLWASALQATGWDSRLELWADTPTPLQIPWVGAAGTPHCNGGTTTAPISESCTKHFEYQSADTWPTWPHDYAVNIRPVASPTGTGGSYTMLIMVMTDVGPAPPPPPPPPPMLTACPSNSITESEPNDSTGTANVLNLAPGNGTIIVSGGITPAGDLDYYRIDLTTTSLVFANVRTNLAAASSDSTLFIGVSPATTGTSCTGTGFTECDDDDGLQAGLSSTISGLELEAGTYYIMVKQFGRTGTPGTGTTMTPYRLYVAVVPTTAIPESEPNDSPAFGNDVMACPALFSGTTATGGVDDFFRFQLPAGTHIAWVSVDEVPIAPPRAVAGWNSQIQFWVAINYPFFTQRPWVTGTGVTPATSLNCNGVGATGSPNPPAESCTVDPVYQAPDTWPGAGVYSINVQPVGATTGSYRVLIVVWPSP